MIGIVSVCDEWVVEVKEGKGERVDDYPHLYIGFTSLSILVAWQLALFELVQVSRPFSSSVSFAGSA